MPENKRCPILEKQEPKNYFFDNPYFFCMNCTIPKDLCPTKNMDPETVRFETFTSGNVGPINGLERQRRIEKSEFSALSILFFWSLEIHSSDQLLKNAQSQLGAEAYVVCDGMTFTGADSSRAFNAVFYYRTGDDNWILSQSHPSSIYPEITHSAVIPKNFSF